MSRYAIAYDVTDDRLRERIRSVCRKYGARQQYSLFEVQLSPTERAQMIEELREIAASADEGRIHVRVYSVGPRSKDVDIPEQGGEGTPDEPANIV